MRTLPKNPSGTIPGKDFVDTGDLSGIKVGIVTRVDEVNLKADLRIITGGGDRFEVDLTQGLAGPRSFLGGIPEVNSVALVGYRRIHKNIYDAVIIGYLPTGVRSGARFDPFYALDPSEVTPDEQEAVNQIAAPVLRYRRPPILRPGDVGGMASGGAEFALNQNYTAVNRSGDTFQLRDVDRTIVQQAVHRIESESGVKRLSGPIRRGGLFLSPDILKAGGTSLRDDADYFGKGAVQATGPGIGIGTDVKFANTEGTILSVFNDVTNFAPTTYSNGRRVHYPPTAPGVGVDDPDSIADTFVEDRLELRHTSDLTLDVLEEIDGYATDTRSPYIERVFGTIVGNDLGSTRGLRGYARILKPRLFPDFVSRLPGKFTLEEADRQPTTPDLEVNTSAGAMLFRIRPPRSVGERSFVAAVSKQGKLFVEIPASTVEDYPSGSKRVSAEFMLEGALKAYIGASNPDRISVHATLEGGLHLDVGRDAKGNAVTTRFHSATKTVYEGNPNDDDIATSIEVRGVKESIISGAEQKTIDGSKATTVSGNYRINADRYNVNAFQGASLNYGELNQLVSGKTQLRYALQVLEDIIAGGKILTILAGGLTETVAAGAVTTNVLAGAHSTNVSAGAYSVTVGAGAVSITTGAGAVTMTTSAGAFSISAVAGAMSLTAGLALNLTAAVACSIVAPQILLGGPAAVLGICRGLPALPPGSPSLDYITGLPLMGSALNRSL
jgi:hypothetical protein